MEYSNPIDFDIDLNEVSKGNKLIPQVQSQLGRGLTGKRIMICEERSYL